MSGAPEIKGWCPGAHRPMASGDGLVVRVRPWAGQITAKQALGLAELSELHGAGVIDITSRANLQLRGISEAGFPAVLSGLDALGLLDATPALEHHRNIVVSPFHNAYRDGVDQEAVASHLPKALLDPALSALPSKFGFVIDAGRARHLAHVSGDIRIEASGSQPILRLDGMERGWPVGSEYDAISGAVNFAHWFVDSGGVGPDGRGRMAAHIRRGAVPPQAEDAVLLPNPSAPASFPGKGTIDGNDGLLLGFAFGQISAAALRHLAGVVGGKPMRVSPDRMLFIPDASNAGFPAHPDIVTHGADPLLRITACPGAPSCSQATVETRDLGRAIAPYLAPDHALHISGCAKGCAHPKPAALTLVGRNGAFDLVRHSAPWDEPEQRGLTPEAVMTLFET